MNSAVFGPNPKQNRPLDESFLHNDNDNDKVILYRTVFISSFDENFPFY